MELSVIIPVYNSAETIIEAMDSVVNECVLNLHNWELILVDDGSDDDSAILIENYIQSSLAKEHIYLISQPNGGAAVARNTGLRIAKGEFIAFNDSDDRWLPGKLKLQMEYMRTNVSVDMLGCIYGSDDFQKGSFMKLNLVTPINIKEQILKNYFSPPTVIIRTKALKKSGLFNESLRFAEEGYFFNNMVYYNYCVFMQEKVAEPIILKNRWGDNGLSGNLIEMERGELFNIRSAYKLGYISLGLYVFAVCFSFVKFLRRWVISKYRKLCK